jgi:hypothetical protein
MKKIFQSLALLLLATNCLAQDVRMLKAVRGARYCEILIIKGTFSELTATVYNTLGCNDCPDATWKQIDAEKVKKEMGARKIIMNGPRYFLMDSIGQSNAPKPKINLGGIDMIERATVKISMPMMLKGKSEPYKEQTIHRSTEYVFGKGSEVYELVSPEHTYIMQSYALIIDTSLTEDALPQLQSKLNLPKDWKYKSFKLDTDLVLKTVGAKEAYVIQDDLDNTYQRIN